MTRTKKIILPLLLMGLLSLCWSQVQAKCKGGLERRWTISRITVQAVDGPVPTEEEVVAETEKWSQEGILYVLQPVPPVLIYVDDYTISFR